jgi:hypothetical protein
MSRSKESLWRKIFSDFTESGKSVAAFCRDRDLPAWQFYYWRKRIQPREYLFEEVAAEESEPVLAEISSSGISLFVDNIEVKLARNFDALALRRVLSVLC